jgi:Fur family ferric uptake transcriptional regulator
VCLRCGKVEEFFGQALQDMRHQVEANLGFRIATARTEMGGYCPDCAALHASESPMETTEASGPRRSTEE